MTVGRQGQRDVGEAGDMVEGVQVLQQRIVAGAVPADVGRDRRQHVVAYEQDSVLRVVQAEMVQGVARRVQRGPLPSRQLDGVAVVETGRGLRHHELPGRAQDTEGQHAAARRPGAGAAPGHGGEGVALGPGPGVALVGPGAPGPEGAESALRHQLGARLLGQAAGGPEVVGVGVGDDDRVHVTQRHPDLVQTTAQGAPRQGPGHARVDHGRAPVVDQGVGVDVPQPRHVDG